MNSSSSASVSPLSESVLLAETLMSRKPLTRSMAWMEREDEEEEVEEHEEQENESERELASSASLGAVTASFVLSTEPPQLDTLPKFILSQIFSYFSYDKVSKLRRVSKRMNEACRAHLNRGFRLVERFHGRLMKEFKSKLPRRESERRSHPLIKHCDILTAIETRISLLAMTFMKYVDADMVCFFPGKVIDEIYDVLSRIKMDRNPPKAYEMLQELRDISSMAMEHFDEKIVPGLKPNPTHTPFLLTHLSSASSSKYLQNFSFVSSPSSGPSSPRPSAITGAGCSSSSYLTPTRRLCIGIGSGSQPGTPGSGLLDGASRCPRYLADQLTIVKKKLKGVEKKSKKMDLEHKKQIREFKQTVTDQNVKLTNLDNLILSQQSLIAAQAEQIKVQDSRLEELALKQIESDRKMTELLTDGLDPKPAAASSCKRKRGSTGEDDEETGSAASATKRKRRSDQK